MITAVARILKPGGANREIGGPRPIETKFSNRQRTERNVYGRKATGGVLSNTQKARLCQESNRAFAVVHGRPPLSTRESDEFRHAQCLAAVGKHGLTKCVQGDYQTLQAWFLELAGQHGAAFEAQLAGGTEPLRVAIAVLERTLRDRGLPIAYVVPICRQIFKCELHECTANQIWKLVFTVRMRREKVEQKGAKSAKDQQSMHRPEDPF
jgi:hypothetical protein